MISMNLKDLFQLAGDSGKLVFVDEDGQVKGVFLDWQNYQALYQKKPQSKIEPERVNQEIIQAQLEPELNNHPNLETLPDEPVVMPEQVSSIISRRAGELFNSKPFGRSDAPDIDLRSEVIDPNFGKEPVEEPDNEEIKPQFEDI